jgi:hypothetical protein
MLGVVLWCDPAERKAVIWCEDHGDLAFYSDADTDADDAVRMDAGDLVQFDLTVSRRMRLAHNPRLVSEGLYSGLADSLTGQGGAVDPSRVPTFLPRESAQIIPFKPVQPEADPARARAPRLA